MYKLTSWKFKGLLIATSVVMSPVAGAQPGGDTSNAPEAGQAPGAATSGNFGGPSFSGGGHGQFAGGPRMRVPTHEQVLSLPSLTPAQRQSIEAIYQQARPTMEPLMQALRQQRMAAGGAGNTPGGGIGSGAANPQQADLRRQIHQQIRSTWDKVQTQLTPDQISQLQQQAKDNLQGPRGGSGRWGGGHGFDGGPPDGPPPGFEGPGQPGSGPINSN